jgi:hypothetical protein
MKATLIAAYPTPLRGLGDVVARVTESILHIPPCAGCKKRQASLNKAVPFGKNLKEGAR